MGKSFIKKMELEGRAVDRRRINRWEVCRNTNQVILDKDRGYKRVPFSQGDCVRSVDCEDLWTTNIFGLGIAFQKRTAHYGVVDSVIKEVKKDGGEEIYLKSTYFNPNGVASTTRHYQDFMKITRLGRALPSLVVPAIKADEAIPGYGISFFQNLD